MSSHPQSKEPISQLKNAFGWLTKMHFIFIARVLTNDRVSLIVAGLSSLKFTFVINF